MESNASQKLNFEISSALKSVIGRDLITNDFVAIFELVKNSYDAGAKKIDIVFEDNGVDVEKIYIIDNGKGMSYNDITSKWLFVAYSAKKDGSEDNNAKKIYAGNKGVGRFSCDRIGGKLQLQSKTKEDKKIHLIDVNWGDFEKDSKEKFENVDIAYRTQENFISSSAALSPEESGVMLVISDLREPSSWSRQKLLKLKRHLEKLINPFGDAESSVQINLICKREIAQDKALLDAAEDESQVSAELVNGEVRNVIFDLLKDRTTSFKVDLDESGYFVSTLIDRGELIYKIKESAIAYPELVGSDFSCQIFYLNLSAKQTFKSRTGMHSVSFGSLFLFRNGFRVFPVGEEGNDYWRIDRRHQQGYARTLGTRDIMGRVNIAGPETKFRESSSRDIGLVETEASRQLHDYITTKCMRRLESYVVGVTWQDAIDKTYENAQRLSLDQNRSNIIELVAKISGADDIELLDYSHNLVDVLNEKSIYFERSVERLAKLAETLGDENLNKNIAQARKRFKELKQSEQEALRIADQELAARIEAEKNAEKQSSLREAAEKNAEKQSTLREEAEQKAESLSIAYNEEKKRNLFLLSGENRDKEQLESFLHQIVIYTSAAKQKITSALLKTNDSDRNLDREEISTSLSELLETVEKIMTTSRFATSANFKLDSTKITDDVCLYIDQYLSTISTAYNSRIQIKVERITKGFVTTFTPIELGMVLDNLVSNAKKARASIILFKISSKTNGVIDIEVEDNGRGLDKSLIEPERIFEKGVTTTRGSGLGLFHSRKQIERMGGELILPESQPDNGFKVIMRLRTE